MPTRVPTAVFCITAWTLLFAAWAPIGVCMGAGQLINDGCALCTVDPLTHKQTPLRFWHRGYDTSVTEPWLSVEGPLTTQWAVQNNVTVEITHPDVNNVANNWPALCDANALDLGMWQSYKAFGGYALSLQPLSLELRWPARIALPLLALHTDPLTDELMGMSDSYEFWGLFYKKSTLSDAGVDFSQSYNASDPRARPSLTAFLRACDLVVRAHPELAGAIGIGLADTWAPHTWWNAAALSIGGDDWWAQVQLGTVNMQTDARMRAVWAVMTALRARFPQPLNSTVSLALADILAGLAPYDPTAPASYAFIFCGSITVTYLAAIGRDIDDYDWIPFPSVDAADLALLNFTDSLTNSSEAATAGAAAFATEALRAADSVGPVPNLRTPPPPPPPPRSPPRSPRYPSARVISGPRARATGAYAGYRGGGGGGYSASTSKVLSDIKRSARYRPMTRRGTARVRDTVDDDDYDDWRLSASSATSSGVVAGQFSTQDTYVVNRVGKNRELALEFLRWHSNDSVALAILTETVNGQMPPQIAVRKAVALPIVERGFRMLDVTSQMHMFIDTTAPAFSAATYPIAIAFLLGEIDAVAVVAQFEVQRQESILERTATPGVSVVDNRLVLASGTVNATVWYASVVVSLAQQPQQLQPQGAATTTTVATTATLALTSYYQYAGPVALDAGSYRVEAFAQHTQMADSVHTVQLVTIRDTSVALPDFQVSPQIGAAVWSVAALLLACTLALSWYLYVHRQHQMVRASSFVFCQLMLLGCACMYVATGLTTLAPSLVTCSAAYAVGYVGFSVTTSALFSKTLRLALIFRSGNVTVQVVRIRDRDVLRYMCVMCALPVLVLVLWLVADPPQATVTSDATYRYTVCQSTNSAWHIAMLCVEALSLLLGCGVAHQVRNTPHLFNESRWIAVSIYNVVAWVAVVAPITMLSLVTRPDAVILVDAVAILFATAATQICIFWPKVERVRLDVLVLDATADASSSNHTNPSVLTKGGGAGVGGGSVGIVVNVSGVGTGNSSIGGGGGGGGGGGAVEKRGASQPSRYQQQQQQQQRQPQPSPARGSEIFVVSASSHRDGATDSTPSPKRAAPVMTGVAQPNVVVVVVGGGTTGTASPTHCARGSVDVSSAVSGGATPGPQSSRLNVAPGNASDRYVVPSEAVDGTGDAAVDDSTRHPTGTWVTANPFAAPTRAI